MTKRLSSKLLAVILTIAICATTVLGCLITASAADDAFSYEWSDGEVTKELDSATIKLTINAPSNLTEDGIVEGYFDLSLSDGLIIKDAQITDGTRVGGLQFDAAEFGDGEDLDGDGIAEGNGQGDVFVTTVNGVDKLEFGCGTEYGYTTLSFELTFGFEGGFAEQGAQYTVNIASNSLWLAGPFGGQYYNHTGELAAGGVLNASCDHVISVKGDPINTDTDNGYTVYKNSYCTNCGEEFGYQLVPSTEPMNGTTICWDGTDDAVLADPEDGEQTGATADSPIIINSAEELHYLATAAGRKATFNKYYKLADGIDKIVLQSSDIANDDDFNSIETADDVQEYFANGNFKKWSENANTSIDNAFAGHFDGNGVTICGLYDNDKTPSGLFPTVHTSEINAGIDETVANNYTKYTSESHASAKLTEDEKFKRVTAEERVVISNVNITNSYIYGSLYMGFVVGTGLSNNTYKEDYWVDIDNCSVYNNYMESSTSSTNSVTYNGLLAGYGAGGSVKRYYSTTAYETGYLAHCGMTVDNCLVYGNKTVAKNKNGVAYDYGIGAMANTSMGEANIFTNSIILGTTPYLSTATANGVSEQGYSSHRSVLDRFNNVYTDVSVEAKYKDKTYNYETGAENGTVNSSYSGRIKKITADGILGYNAVTACPNLDWGNVWSYGADGEYPSLASGSSNIIYWNGSTGTHPTEQDSDGTYIINTAEELHYIAQRKGTTVAETTGNTYKIADDIDAIVLQPYATVAEAGGVEKLMSLSSSDAVYDYFKNSGITFTSWVVNSDETPFNGSFDGNGVEIYGLYADGTQVNAGLFRAIDTGKPDENGDNAIGNTFRNFAIKNSYFETKRRMGAIAALTRESGYNNTATPDGIIHIENCEISNCYMYCNSTNTYERTVDGVKVNTYNVGSNENGILVGTVHSGSDVLQAENCLIYGNYAKFKQWSKKNASGYYHVDEQTEDGYSLTDITLVGNTGNKLTIAGTEYKFAVDSSIVLGTPFNSNFTVAGGYYTNVYTDNEGDLTGFGGDVITYSDIIGTQAKDNMPNLQWDNDWYTNVNGYPTLAALDETRVSTISNGSFGLTAYNTSYNNDGSLDFNFYFKAQQGYDYKLYVGKTDSKSGYTSFLELAASDVTTPAIIEQLGASAKVFTIPRLSSRDVNTIWVPTVVATNGAVTEWGKSEQIALADYANGILNDEAVYAENVTDATKLADKKVAAALLNYADAATIALTTPNDQPVAKNKIVYAPSNAYDGSFMTNAADGVGDTPENPYIIKTYGHWRYLAEQATYDQTNGKYFKVDPTIKMFVFQSEDYINSIGGLDAFMALDAQGVYDKLYLTSTSRMQHNNTSTEGFAGTIDGSGVEIVGLYYPGSGGLIGKVADNATIKNLTISHSCIYTTSDATNGMVVGQIVKKNASKTNVGVVSFENIALHDNYQSIGASGLDSTGVMLGSASQASQITIKMNNIIACDNISLSQVSSSDTSTVANALVGNYNGGWNGGNANDADPLTVNGEYKNIITLGCAPYPVFEKENQGTKPEYWFNVYTDTVTKDTPCTQTTNSSVTPADKWTSYDITKISANDVIGAAAMTTCPALDWEEGWMITSGYPQPVQSGYTATAGKTIYWDNTVATGFASGTGEEGDPYIIETAAQLAYLVKALTKRDSNGDNSIDATQNKHFKIADGIDNIVLQSADYAADIISKNSAAEVKAYFDANADNMYKWANEGWEQGSFCGTFDGNGATVYGLYQDHGTNAGLFSTVDAGATIKNITVKNSYLKSTINQSDGSTASYQVGAIAAVVSNSSSNSAKNAGIVWIDNCKVINNYMTHDTTDNGRCGTVLGAANADSVYITNCLVYGNDAAYNNGIPMPLVGDMSNSVKTDGTAIVPKGLTPVKRADNSTYYANGVHNTITIGSAPYNLKTMAEGNGKSTAEVYKNVYTDVAIKTVNNTTIVSDLSILKGSKAADIVATLNGDNGATWYVGAAGDYPGFEKAGAIPNWLQAEYDANTFSKFNSYSSVNSQLGLKNMGFNLGANPYMSFVFNFDGAYKTDRQNIKVFIEYSVDGSTYVTKEVSVPAFTEGVALSEGGWLSKATSTNHTYEFTDLPIKAFMHDIKVYVQYDGEAADKVTKTQVGTVSAEGLVNAFINANKKKPCNLNAATAEAAKALYFYVEMVNARYA